MDGLTGVARLQQLAGTRFEHITAAQSRSDQRLLERRDVFARSTFDADAAIVLTGSWGRHEVTSASDDDFMVLFADAERKGARPSVAEAAAILNGKPSGSEPVFAQQV